MFLKHLVGFGVELRRKKKCHELLHYKSNRAQTSRINDRWSTFFSFAYPGAALVPCEIASLGWDMIEGSMFRDNKHTSLAKNLSLRASVHRAAM